MTQSTTENTKKPTHYVRYKAAKSDYRQIGAAWQDEDGNLSVKLDGMPICDWDGALFLRKPKQQDIQGASA